jgi:hypothetical protein
VARKKWCPLEGQNDDGLIHDARELLYHRLPFPDQIEDVRHFFELAPSILKTLKIEDPLDVETSENQFWLRLEIADESRGRLKYHEGLAILAIYEATRGDDHYLIALAFLQVAKIIALKEKVTQNKKLQPDAARGRRVSEGARLGGQKIGKQKRELKTYRKKAWQKEADKLWRRHPSWGNVDVAVELEKIFKNHPELKASFNTIRLSIIKP